MGKLVIWRERESYCQEKIIPRREILSLIGNEKCARIFFAQTFWTPPGVRDIPAKFPGHPGFLSSKPKEDKVSRAGTKFSATTPSRGRSPPHRAVSGPKKLIFVLFFRAWPEGKFTPFSLGGKIIPQKMFRLFGDFGSVARTEIHNPGSRRGREPLELNKIQDIHSGRKLLPTDSLFFQIHDWPRGSTGVQRYGCIPRSAANNLGEIPKNLGAPNLLFWRVFGWRERCGTRPC